MGGNRGGEVRTTINLFLTMLIGGLWHGANWTFVIWGAYHGVLLIVYRLTARRWDALPVAVSRGLMLLLVVIGWVLFRCTDLSMAGAFFTKMFTPTGGTSGADALPLAVLVIAAGAWSIWGKNAFEFHEQHAPSARSRLATAFTFGIAFAVILGSRPSPFLYFQF